MNHVPTFLLELPRGPSTKERIQETLRSVLRPSVEAICAPGDDPVNPERTRSPARKSKPFDGPSWIVREQRDVVSSMEQSLAEIKGVKPALNDDGDLHRINKQPPQQRAWSPDGLCTCCAC